MPNLSGFLYLHEVQDTRYLAPIICSSVAIFHSESWHFWKFSLKISGRFPNLYNLNILLPGGRSFLIITHMKVIQNSFESCHGKYTAEPSNICNTSNNDVMQYSLVIGILVTFITKRISMKSFISYGAIGFRFL